MARTVNQPANIGNKGAANITSIAMNKWRLDELSLKFSSDMWSPIDLLNGADCRLKPLTKVVLIVQAQADVDSFHFDNNLINNIFGNYLAIRDYLGIKKTSLIGWFFVYHY